MMCSNAPSGGGGSANAPIDKKLAEMWQQEEKQLTELRDAKSGYVEIDGVLYSKYTQKDMLSLLNVDVFDYDEDTKKYSIRHDDEMVSVKYKNGSVEYYTAGDEISHKFTSKNVDSVIYEDGNGYIFSGKNIEFYNFNRDTDNLEHEYKRMKKQNKKRTTMHKNDFVNPSDWRLDIK